MKKKILLILMLVCTFFFSTNFVYAEEVNTNESEDKTTIVAEDKTPAVVSTNTEAVTVDEPKATIDNENQDLENTNEHSVSPNAPNNSNNNINIYNNTSTNSSNSNSNSTTSDTNINGDNNNNNIGGQNSSDNSLLSNDNSSNNSENGISNTNNNESENGSGNENENLQNQNNNNNDFGNNDSAENINNENETIQNNSQNVENENVSNDNNLTNENYNVIFNHENFNYIINGGDSTDLRTIFRILHINIDVQKVVSVESSNNSVLKIVPFGSDFIIQSLGAFDTQEKLTIKLNDGSIFFINITDPAGDKPEHTKTIRVNPKTDANGDPICEKNTDGTCKVDENGNIIYEGDGTYTIELTVKGDSEKHVTKVNVIIIVDKSGSMSSSSGTTSVSYTETTNDWFTPQYGLINGEYVELTRTQDGYGWGATVTWSYNGTPYTGTRYFRQESNQNRMQATQSAVNNLAQSLFSNNGGDNPDDVVEIALVSFSTNATIANTTPTNTYSTFAAAVNALNANGGTNWEEALQKANTVDFGDDDQTYVIFVSDGAPTFHSTDGGYNNWNQQYQVYGTGHDGDGTNGTSNNTTNMNNSYNQATDDAATLATKVGVDNFYTIFAYGPDYGSTYMKNLTTAAGAPEANAYSAANTAGLQTALAEILHKIEMAGIGSVSMVDGTTSHVVISETAASEEFRHLLDVDKNSFKYYKDDVIWPDAPEATLNAAGQVVWNLGPSVLDNGVVYKVTFECWPSQDTLDLIADLKNNPDLYDDESVVPAAIKPYLVRNCTNGVCTYDLKTNTTATLSYVDTRISNQVLTEEFINPDPVGTTASEMMSITKMWVVDDASEFEDEDVEFWVARDGEKKDQIVLTVDPNNPKKFTGGINIAVGIMTEHIINNQEVVDIKAPGHDFKLIELGEDAYHWEIKARTIRPMLINNELKLLVLSETVPTGKYYTIDGKYYTVEDINNNEIVLDAINERRSNVDIKKVSSENAPADDEYVFTIKATSAESLNPDDKYIWFSVVDTNSGSWDPIEVEAYTVGEGAHKLESEVQELIPSSTLRITGYDATTKTITYETYDSEKNVWNSHTVREYGDTAPGENYKYYTEYYFINSGLVFDNEGNLVSKGEGDTFTIVMKNGYSIRLRNVLSGTQFEVSEAVPANYNLSITNDIGTVSGNKVTGTVTSTQENYLMTFNNDYQIMTVTASKKWDDVDDQDGIRTTVAAATTVQLFKKVNGVETALFTPVTIPATNAEISTWTNLPKYEGEYEIEYFVREVLPENSGYTAQITGSVLAGFLVKNSHTPETKKIEVTKIWVDANDQDKVRPTAVEFTVTGSDGKTYKATLSGTGNTWTQEVEVEKYSQGAEVTFTVDEEASVEKLGYTKSIDGLTITNTRKPETKKIEVTKIWVDANDQDKVRPTAVEFTVTGSDGKTYKATLSGTGNTWTQEVEVEKYSQGAEVTFTVDEEASVEKLGYTKSIDGLTITNTRKPETKKIEVTKIWVDANDQDKVRPTAVEFTVTGSDGKTYKATLSGTGNTWTQEVEVEKYSQGAEVTFTVDEEASVEKLGYTKSIDGLTITNTRKPETKKIEVTKIWVDANDQDKVRPTAVEFTVTGSDGKTYKATLSGTGNTWTQEVEVEKYSQGAEVTFTVDEEASVEKLGYTKSIDGLTITNTRKPETKKIEVTKIWVDANDQDKVRPTAVEFTVTGSDGKTYKATLSGTGNTWTQEVEVEKYSQGAEVTFTVDEEASVEKLGYTKSIDGLTITNTRKPETKKIEVTKIWVDANDQDKVRPTAVEFTVTGSDGKTYKATLSGTGNTWTQEVEVEKYSQGAEVTFTVDEEASVEKLGYTKSIDGLTITNTRKPETKKIEVTKIWVDANDQDKVRPTAVEFTVTGSDGKTYKATLSGTGNTWTQEVEVEKYSQGAEVTFTVDEEASVEKLGYTKSIDGLTITNTRKPETKKIEVTKIWVDANDQDKVRPTAVEFTVTGSDGKTYKATLSGTGNTWTQEVEVEKYSQGAEVTFTVDEEASVEKLGYTKSIDGLTITNTREVAVRPISVEKIWDDKDNYNNLRPSSISVEIYADGQLYKTVELNESNDWKYSENLPVNNEGKEVIYTINEVEVPEYYTEIEGDMNDGFVITNSYFGEGGDVPPVNPRTADPIFTYLAMLLISLAGFVKFTYSYIKNL